MTDLASIFANCGITEADLAAARASAEAEELADIRNTEMRTEVAAATDSFAAYWADSASASVIRDYRAGRVS